MENQDTIYELTARIQELQNEVNCLNNSRDSKDAESVRSGLSHVTSQPALLNPWISNVTEDTPVLTSTERPVTCDACQIPDTVLNPRFQTGPSAGNSVIPSEGDSLKNYGADQQRLQILRSSFRQIPFSSNVCFLEGKIQD